MSYNQHKGKYQAEYEKLFRALVPQNGDADSIQGQILLSISNLANQWSRRSEWSLRQEEFLSYLGKHLTPEDYFDVEDESQSASPFVYLPFDEQVKSDLFYIALGRPASDELDDCPELWNDFDRKYAYEKSLDLWPSTDTYGPFSRLTDCVVELCFANQALVSSIEGGVIEGSPTINQILKKSE